MGSVSTADGHRVAFGGTEERQRVNNLGLHERGKQDDGPWRRSGDGAGTGWVQARDGVYADSLRKHIRLVLLVCESTGAVNRAGVTLLRSLERATRRKRGRVQDGTLYGTTPASIDSFTRYHLTAIAVAIIAPT